MSEKIKRKLNAYVESILAKDTLTIDDYTILLCELNRHKQESIEASNDTIMRIFTNLG